MIDFDADRDPLDLLAEEFAERWRHGEQPTVGEYAEKYPDLAEQLRDVLPPVAKMEQLKRLKTPVRVLPVDDVKLRRLGDYRILREVGRGGMGIVYEAVQETLGRHVALKVLPRHAQLEAKKLERFQREARSAARLHHTNIVPVFGVGEDDGLHYYVMQFIEGRGLNDMLAELRGSGVAHRPTPPTIRIPQSDDSLELAVRVPETVDPARPSGAVRCGERCRQVAGIGIQAAQALHYAHRQGILHRDIKPANLLLDAAGTVWITDFGLAKEIHQKGLTHTGDVLGTLHYLAPEGLHGEADERSDVYALGVTLYELLTLELPFNAVHPAGLLRQVLDQEPRPPRQVDPTIPRDLETIVLKAIARDPAQRYPTAEALADDLQRFLDDRPIQARRATMAERAWRWCRRNRALAGLTAAVVLLLGLAAVIGWTGYVSTMAALEREAQKKAEAEAATRRAQENVELSLRKFEEMFNHIAQRERTHGRSSVGFPPFAPPVSEEDAALLMSILTFYDRFAESNETNPGLQREAAKANRRVAEIYHRLGQPDKADTAYRRAAAIYERLVADFPQAGDYRRELAETYTLTGSRAPESPEKAEERLRRALALVDGQPESADLTLVLARIQSKLGTVLQQRSRDAEAENAYRSSVALYKGLIDGSAGPHTGFELATTRYALAAFLLREDRPDEARALLEESIAEMPALTANGPRHRGWGGFGGHSQRLLAQHYESLADAWTRLGDSERAKEAAQKARELTAKSPPPGPRPGREGKTGS